jgi:transcriptional regulator NrdR family protein
MKCPRCGAWSDVMETRANEGGNVTRRRRVCANNHRFTTLEYAQPSPASSTRTPTAKEAASARA